MKRLARGIWIPLLLLLAGFAVYANALDGPFIFDDIDSIVENPHIRQAWPPTYLWQAPAQATVAGRPLVSLSLAANHALGGYQMRGYHLLNVLLHGCVACLLFALIRRSAASARVPTSIREKATLIAAASAALWVVHPLNSEAVNYIVQRTELMMALFYLLTIYAGIRALEPSRRLRWSSISVVACLLGVACKESIVTAPLALMLHDWVFLSREQWRALRRQRLALYAAVCSSWIAVGGLMLVAPRSESVGFGLGVTAFDYARSQALILLDYGFKALWPARLLIDYGHARPLPPGQGIVTGVLILVVGALVCLALYRRRLWSYLAVWPLLLLAPTSSFVPIVTEVGAERRMYLPLMGLIAMLVIGVSYALFVRSSANSLLRRQAILLCAGLIIAAAWATRERNSDYADVEQLWLSGLVQRPDIPRLHSGLGRHYQLEGRLDEAIDAYREALTLDPEFAEVHFNLGTAFSDVGDREGAIRAYSRSLELNPRRPEAQHNLGSELANLGRFDEALPRFSQAVELKPDWIEARRSLAQAFRMSGDPRSARLQLERALEIDDKSVDLLSDLSWLLATSDFPDADRVLAVSLAQRAVELSHRKHAMALDSWSVALAASGSDVEAVEIAEEALRVARQKGEQRLVGELERRLLQWRGAGAD